MRTIRTIFLMAAAAGLLAGRADAASEVTSVQKVFGKTSSPPDTPLPAGSTFTTGPKSGAELSDRRATLRVGQQGEMEMTKSGLQLRKGATLVASQPGLFRKSIEVRAPGYRAKVKGTAQIGYVPGKMLKIVVLEGSVTVSLDSLLGEFVTLAPGQQLIINPSDNRLPEVVNIDLGRLVSTSQLVKGDFGQLSTAGLIEGAVQDQLAGIGHGRLDLTPLVMRGMDSELQLRQAQYLAEEERNRRIDPVIVERTVFLAANDLDDPGAVVGERTYSGGQQFSLFPEAASGGTLTITRLGAKTNLMRVELNGEYAFDPFTSSLVPSSPATISGTIRVDPDVFSGPSQTLEFNNNAQPDFGMAGFEDLQVAPGTDIETPAGVGLTLRSLGMKIDGARLQAGPSPGTTELLSLRAVSGNIQVLNGSVLNGGRVEMAGSTVATSTQTIEVSQSNVTARRSAAIGVATVPTNVVIHNSSEIAAILDNLDVLSAGGAITIDSAKLSAGRQITIDSYKDGTGAAALVTLRNAQITAETIRARGYAPSGDALIIDGSNLKASQLIKLYAEGASTLRFRNHVTLDTPRAHIAGHVVRVDPGGTVNITGKGDVYTNHAEFNTAGTGTMNAGGGLTTQSYNGRPAF